MERLPGLRSICSEYILYTDTVVYFYYTRVRIHRYIIYNFGVHYRTIGTRYRASGQSKNQIMSMINHTYGKQKDLAKEKEKSGRAQNNYSNLVYELC